MRKTPVVLLVPVLPSTAAFGAQFSACESWRAVLPADPACPLSMEL